MADVTIDNQKYDLEALSEEAKTQLGNLRICEDKITQLKRDLAIAQTARNTYAAALREQLPQQQQQ